MKVDKYSKLKKDLYYLIKNNMHNTKLMNRDERMQFHNLFLKLNLANNLNYINNYIDSIINRIQAINKTCYKLDKIQNNLPWYKKLLGVDEKINKRKMKILQCTPTDMYHMKKAISLELNHKKERNLFQHTNNNNNKTKEIDYQITTLHKLPLLTS